MKFPLPVKILKSRHLEEAGEGGIGRAGAGGGEPCCLAQSANCLSLCFSLPLEDELYVNCRMKDLS